MIASSLSLDSKMASQAFFALYAESKKTGVRPRTAALLNAGVSVAAAKTNVFRKNDITVGVKFVKIWKKKLDKIDIIKSRRVQLHKTPK